jgi:copper(I)-binding protein
MKKKLLVSLVAFAATTAYATQQSDIHSASMQASVLMAHAGHSHDAPQDQHADHAHDHGSHGHVSQHSSESVYAAPLSKIITVESCWIRAIPAPAPSAGYFLVKNAGDKEVKLVAAASKTYDMVMLHQTKDEGGMSRMSMADDVAIPAKGELEFRPGGYHAMLEKPVAAPAIGSRVEMDFLFDTGEKAAAQCEVKPANTQVKKG